MFARYLGVASLVLIGFFGDALASEEPVRIELDPKKVVTHETCIKCHGNEIEAWKQTPHFRTFRELHRKDEAKQIAKKMGISSIKRGGICIQCHYTPQDSGGVAKPVAGVSCESCHGAAADWLAIHNDYGGPEINKEAESSEHRRQRLESSIKKGMRNPENVYLIAQSCYGCHTVPNEKLVNVGGHVAGSVGFDLVSWSQGTIRHNFLRSGGTSNIPSSRERLRVMHVVGLMADLEYSLRATAEATEKSTFGFTSAKRAFDARKQLAEIQDKISDPRLEKVLEAAYGVKLKLGNRENLLAAAREISQSAFEFAATSTGNRLSAIDNLLPSESTYK
jgi:hypothetical protein